MTKEEFFEKITTEENIKSVSRLNKEKYYFKESIYIASSYAGGLYRGSGS